VKALILSFQAVTFLGLLYNMFDEIIDRNDVYKVYTCSFV